MTDKNLSDKSKLFNAVAHECIELGLCVIVGTNKQIVFAGSIDNAPKLDDGVTVLLNPSDFAMLEDHVKKHRH